MLIDDRGALAVVAHPGHQIFEARAAGCREVVPGVPEIVKVQAFGAGGPDGLWPGRHLVEVAAAQRTTPDPGEDERFGLYRCSRTVGIDEGMPTMRRAAFDFGGPRTSSPVDRSAYAAPARERPSSRRSSLEPSKITLKGGACGAVTRDAFGHPDSDLPRFNLGAYRKDGQDWTAGRRWRSRIRGSVAYPRGASGCPRLASG